MSTDTISKIKNINLNTDNRATVDDYHILAEQAVSLEKVYIVDLSVKRVGEDVKCAVATSDHVSEVYKLCNTQWKLLTTLKGHSKPVTNVRFCHESDNILYSSSLDGKLKIWDLRTGECTKELKDPGLKPLSCLDVSCHDRVLCAGTELVEGDAFLLFWDIRSRQMLGGYWESHTDDITSVAFHPTEPDSIASSSTDGLVNLFDLRESNEDDALQTSLNSESSVLRARWNGDDVLSVITHTETVQQWRRDGARPVNNWSREEVAVALAAPADDCYIVNVHSHSDDEMFILAGSHGGKGENLHGLPIHDGKIKHGPALVGNRQIIRVSEFIPQEHLLITGGESGCLCVWKPESDKISSNLKKAAKIRNKQKHRPY